MVREASFTNRFDVDEMMKVGWFRFMEKNVNSRYGFEIQALLNLNRVKRSECLSLVSMGDARAGVF